MKKYLFPALALGLVMTSCQSDEPFAPGEGGEKQVTFTLNVPGELGTRAAAGANQSDKGGATNQGADQIKYTLVLQANNDTQILNHDQATVSGTTATFKPTVVLGREYTITAYASLKDAWNGENPIAITNSFNDESKDAYFKTLKYNFANGDLQPLTLTRPFGKLRLVAEDYDPAKTKVESVTITYHNSQEGTFNATTEAFTIPNQGSEVTEVETKGFGYYEAADATGAHTVFAEYLPAPKEGEYPVTFTVLVKYDGSTETYSRTFNDIPVRRNALTTLSGNFFTAGAEITVNVEDNFDNFIPGEGNAEEQLRMVAIMGGSYTLPCDIVLSEPLKVEADMTLNLNGKTISNPNGYAIENYSKLTISGEGDMNGLGGIRSHGGEIVINGGTFTGSSDWNNGTYQHILKAVNTEVTINGGEFDATIGGMTNAMINVSENSVVTINAGTFKNVNGMIPQFAPYMFTYEKNGKLIINGGDFYGGWRFNGETATTDIYGGNFTVSYDGQSFHAASTHVLTIYGGTFSLENGGKLNPANHLATGYKVLETTVDGVKYYSVVKEGAVIENPIVSASQLQALGGTKLSGTYNLLADIDMAGYDMTPMNLQNSLVFNGNGHTIKNLNLVQDYQNGMYVSGLFNILHSGAEITVNDLKFVNSKSQSGKYSAVVLAYNSTSAVINLNNVDVDGATISAETVSPLVGYTTGSINLKDCDVANISMTGEKPEKIGAYVGTANQATCNVIVSNCTNNTEYKEAGRVINGATMTIDGMQYVANNDALANALNSGANNILLAAGEFEMPGSFSANNVTISGADKENSILKITSQLRADNKSLTLKNLTTKVPTGLYYSESTFAWIHYLKNFSMINCNSDGRIRLNSHSATIEKCRFDVTTSSGFDGYAIFYYGPTDSNVKVSNSVFNTVGKAIVLYNEGQPVLNLDVTNCQFKSSASTDKAAIQMHAEYGISGTVDIVNSSATGFANINGGLWNELNNNTKETTDNFEITVDGVKVH